MSFEDLPEELFSPTDPNSVKEWSQIVDFCNNLAMIGKLPKQVRLSSSGGIKTLYITRLAVALSLTNNIEHIGLDLSQQSKDDIMDNIINKWGLNSCKFDRTRSDTRFSIDIIEYHPEQDISMREDNDLFIIKMDDPDKWKETFTSLWLDRKVFITPKYKLIFCEKKRPIKPEPSPVSADTDIPSLYKIGVESINTYPFLDEVQWKRNLVSFLTNLSIQVWGEDNLFVKHGFDQEELRVWAKAFTHESYDRNPENNYETLEYLGDKIMGSAFAIYLFNMHEDIVNNQLNSLGVFYLSKVRQHNMSQYLQLTKVARTFYDYGIKLSEDLIESFFGAVYVVADRIQYGQGNAMAYRLIQYLFKDIKIDLSESQVSPVIDLNELFQLYGWGLIGDENNRGKRKQQEVFSNNIVVNILGNGKKETCLMVSNQVLETISSNSGLPIEQVRQTYSNNCLVRIENEGNMLPHEKLAERTLQILESYDINRKLSNNKPVRIQNESDYKLALRRAISDGYDDVYFPKISGNSNTYYIQLVGTRTCAENNHKQQHDILVTVKISCKDNPSNILKPLALKLYIRSGKQLVPYVISYQ